MSELLKRTCPPGQTFTSMSDLLKWTCQPGQTFNSKSDLLKWTCQPRQTFNSMGDLLKWTCQPGQTFNSMGDLRISYGMCNSSAGVTSVKWNFATGFYLSEYALHTHCNHFGMK